ncbi:MAG: hypothetical protein ACTSWI_03475, partial [Alphaproteobacteria bacterium]
MVKPGVDPYTQLLMAAAMPVKPVLPVKPVPLVLKSNPVVVKAPPPVHPASNYAFYSAPQPQPPPVQPAVQPASNYAFYTQPPPAPPMLPAPQAASNYAFYSARQPLQRMGYIESMNAVVPLLPEAGTNPFVAPSVPVQPANNYAFYSAPQPPQRMGVPLLPERTVSANPFASRRVDTVGPYTLRANLPGVDPTPPRGMRGSPYDAFAADSNPVASATPVTDYPSIGTTGILGMLDAGRATAPASNVGSGTSPGPGSPSAFYRRQSASGAEPRSTFHSSEAARQMTADIDQLIRDNGLTPFHRLGNRLTHLSEQITNGDISRAEAEADFARYSAELEEESQALARTTPDGGLTVQGGPVPPEFLRQPDPSEGEGGAAGTQGAGLLPTPRGAAQAEEYGVARATSAPAPVRGFRSSSWSPNLPKSPLERAIEADAAQRAARSDLLGTLENGWSADDIQAWSDQLWARETAAQAAFQSALTYTLSLPEYGYATGWNPTAVGEVDTSGVVEILNGLPIDAEEARFWADRIEHASGPEELHEWVVRLDKEAAQRPELRDVTSALRTAIDQASYGTYLDQEEGSLQPLFYSQDQVRDDFGWSGVPSYFLGSQTTGWRGDNTPVDLTRLLPVLQSYEQSDVLSPYIQRQVDTLIGAIEEGDMTTADVFYFHLSEWEPVVRDRGADDQEWNLANMVAGTMVQELNRATDGESADALYGFGPAEAREADLEEEILGPVGFVQALPRSILDAVTFGADDRIAAGWNRFVHGIPPEITIADRQHDEAILQRANPNAWALGQTVGELALDIPLAIATGGASVPVRMVASGAYSAFMDGLRLGLENPDEFWSNFGWGAGTSFAFNSLAPAYTALWPDVDPFTDAAVGWLLGEVPA